MLFLCVLKGPETDDSFRLTMRGMIKSTKQHGRIYTPKYLVNIILDFAGYYPDRILKKHIIDNSCGDGAFLQEVVHRYCIEFLNGSSELTILKAELETYIHGIEIDEGEQQKCRNNLDNIVANYGLTDVRWDVLCGDTLHIDHFNHKMDYVVGNPPYVRVHNLENNYEDVKQYRFAQKGMTDLFIVFFEIGFKMLSDDGVMCMITPSSWLSSKAGQSLRSYILSKKNCTGLLDLGHFQPFHATTYTLISRFQADEKQDAIDYYTFNDQTLSPEFQEAIPLTKLAIGNGFYLSTTNQLQLLHGIAHCQSERFVMVKNGFATLSDRIFISDFNYPNGTIDILKASTGKWSKCIFPYDKNGNPLSLDTLKNMPELYTYLLNHKEELAKHRDIENETAWYLFGRTQAIKDVYQNKYAINTVIKNKGSIRLEQVPSGKGVYSGLYIHTDVDFETIRKIIMSDDFIEYIKILKKYKSGGYYTFSSKNLEQFLNYNLTKLYGQSRISSSSYGLFP